MQMTRVVTLRLPYIGAYCAIQYVCHTSEQRLMTFFNGKDKANERLGYLMVSDHRRPRSRVTPATGALRCHSTPAIIRRSFRYTKIWLLMMLSMTFESREMILIGLYLDGSEFSLGSGG